MLRLVLRRLFVALDWLLLFGLAIVFLLVVVAPLVGGILGRNPILGILAGLLGLVLAAVVATMLNGSVRRSLLTAHDEDAGERSRLRPRLLGLLALALALPLLIQFVENRGGPTAARSSGGAVPSPTPSDAGVAGISRPAPTREPDGPLGPTTTSPPHLRTTGRRPRRA